MGRVYESKKTGRESAPITKAQIEGKEPLRTFGALKQLFTTLHEPAGAEPATEAKPTEKAKRKPAPVAPEAPVADVAVPTGGLETPPDAGSTPAPEVVMDPGVGPSDPPVG